MRIFLTGATGLIGGALAGALLDAGHEVVALVRGAGRSMIDMEGCDRAGEVSAVAGDIALPGFGLVTQPDGLDLVIHCAATVAFDAPAEQHEAINVGGTREAIALARAAGCPLLHVSTAYVCGRRDGPVPEAPVDLAADFANGYEASKARAEALVLAARGEGLVAAIARPGIVLGRLVDGAIRKIDGFHHLFRLFGSPLLGPVPALPHAGFAIVPIDHVVAGLRAMAEDMAAFDGRAVHLVGAEPFVMAEMLRIVALYGDTHPAEMIAPEAYDPAMLDRRRQMVHRRVGAQYFDYFLRCPRFEARGLEEVAGIAAPLIDEAAFRRMIDFCVETGFLDWEVPVSESPPHPTPAHPE